MMKLDSFYFVPLSSKEKLLLKGRLQSYRASVLNSFLEKVDDPSVAERLGDRISEVRSFLSELIFLSKESPDEFWQVVGNWGATFLLARLFNDEEHDANQLDYLVSNLNSLLLFERLLKNYAPGRAVYDTLTDGHGRVHGILQSASVRLRGDGYSKAKVEWDCSEDKVAVSLSGENKARFNLSLPLQPDHDIELIPFSRTDSWNLPIIEDTVALGVKEFNLEESDFYHNDPDGWQPLSMAESLNGAYEVLRDLWPEVIDWGEALVPAFGDMGGLPSKTVHRSASYGPGSPIFITRVGDPFLHAEDLVHEIQHQRFFMFLDKSIFKSWDDNRLIYVSPYRSDPRPLRGLIVGLHAFLSVNELRAREMNRNDLSERQIYQMLKSHYMNLFAFRTVLEHEEITDKNVEFFTDMANSLVRQHSVVTPLVPVEMGSYAENGLERHVATLLRGAQGVVNTSPDYRNWEETIRLAKNVGQTIGVRL